MEPLWFLSVATGTIGAVSVYMLDLPGWDGLSIWGWDDGLGCFYAQLTRNGNSDDDGPDVWITPGPRFTTITEIDALATTISTAIGVGALEVRVAMNSGLAVSGRAPAFPVDPDPTRARRSSG